MKKPTNETAGKFVTTLIRHEDGRTVRGASFLYDDGHQRAVFHLFPVSNGVYTFTGLVPHQLDKHERIETILQGVALVESLN